MIGGLTGGLVTVGLILMLIDWILLFTGAVASWQQLFEISFLFKLVGIMLCFIGLIILYARMFQTNAGALMEIPNSKRVILFHQRRGRNPNVRILVGKLTDLEFIRTKNKLFKDTGGGFRIAGHDCRHTHETICADIPGWLGEYFYKIRKRYGVENIDELQSLYKQLKKVNDTEDAEIQLNNIEILKPIMGDEEKKEQLLDLTVDDFHHMSELLYDGTTRHMEDVEAFVESATPNELDALEKQEFLNEMMREKNYSDPGEFNFSKWFPYITTLILVCAVAVVMIMGVFGGS